MNKVFSLRPVAEKDFAKAKDELVVVTGASGMLGRETVLELLRRGYQVRVVQRSTSGIEALLPESIRNRFSEVRAPITDAQAMLSALTGASGVVHLAAKVSFAGKWQDFLYTNVQGTRTLLEMAKKVGISKFLMISSPSVAHTGSSFAGDGNAPATAEFARGHYARSKAMAENLALESDSDDFWVGVLRPHIVWGPGDTQLVERILDRSAQGRLPLLNNGSALIDSTYIDNAADAIAQGYERLEQIHGTPLVVTNGQPRMVAELLTGMCQAVGVPAPERSLPAPLARFAGKVIERVWAIRPGQDEPPMTEVLAEQLSTSHWFDQSLTQELLDWTPSVSIEAGYKKLSEFYGNSYRQIDRSSNK